MSNIIKGNFPDNRGTPPTKIRKKSVLAEGISDWTERYGAVNCAMIIWCVAGGGLTLLIWLVLLLTGIEGVL